MTEESPAAEESSDAAAAPAGRIFKSAHHRRIGLAVLGAGVVLVGGGVLALRVAAPTVLQPAWLETHLAAAGPWAPVVFVALQATQVVLAPIPGQVLAGVGGYLFGPVQGSVYTLMGVLIGSSLVFVGARRYGRPFVARLVTADTLARFDSIIDQYGAAGLFVLFLLPTFPDDALCLIAGLSPIRPRTFLLLLVVGRAPTFVAAAYAGAGVAAGDYWLALAVLGGLVALTLGVAVVRHRLDNTGHRSTTE
jgi:uncharacterized membrane protein YdjX (TVP38/TMEM64 family)